MSPKFQEIEHKCVKIKGDSARPTLLFCSVSVSKSEKPARLLNSKCSIVLPWAISLGKGNVAQVPGN